MLNYLFIIVIIIIFIYLNKNSNKETFYSYNIKQNKTILWKHKNLYNVINETHNIVFKKSDTPYYSNDYINNNSFLTGYIFKPMKCKNIKIGLSDLNKENKINYCFNILGDNYFKIEEIEEEKDIRTSQYIIQDLDYCFNPNILGCTNNKNLFKYNDDDIFCITINNNKINYILIKNYNTDNKLGILIHKSKTIIKSITNLYCFILNNNSENKISNNNWISRKYDDSLKHIDWSIKYLNENEYDRKELPEKEDLPKREKHRKLRKRKRILTFPKNIRKVIIYKVNINDNNKININDENILNIQLLYHNIYINYLKELYSIDTIIYFDSKHLIIPFNVNYKFMDNKIEFEKYFYQYLVLKVNISKYINLFTNKKIKIQVVLRKFKISDDNLNIKSNLHELKI